MHDVEKRNRFIELRAQGWSLARIAAELHVAKRTLVEWNRAARADIAELQDIEREALQERLLVSHEEELARLTAHLNRIEAILAKRNLECLSTESLFVMAATVRAQLRRLTVSPALVFEKERSRQIVAAAAHAPQAPDATVSMANGGAV